MEQKNNKQNGDMLTILIDYLQTRPLILKLFDIAIIAVIAFTLSTAYILATNFRIIFNVEQQNHDYNEFVKAARIKEKVGTIMDHIIFDTNAVRVGVYQFHDGTAGIGKIPFFFYSQTYEKTAKGLTQEILNNQRIPISVEKEMTNSFMNNKCYFVNKIDEQTDSGHMYSQRGTVAYAKCPIFDLQNKLIGFVCLEFNNLNEVGDEKKLLEDLYRYAQNIAGVMVDN